MNRQPITALAFSASHPVDSDWITAMGDKLIIPWKSGDKIVYSGYKGTIIKHYQNGMFDIRLVGSGSCCVSASELVGDV